MPENKLLFGSLGLDDKISDCPYPIPVNTDALLKKFGKDATWRAVLAADRNDLLALHGFSKKTVDKLYGFTSTYVKYSFIDLL